MAEKDDYLADVLVDLGFAPADQVAKAREEASASGVGVVDLLLANKVIRPADVTQAKAAQFGAEVVHLGTMRFPTTSSPSSRATIAKKYRVIPVFKTDGKVAVAIADPSDLNTIDSLTHLLNAEIELRVASEPDIEAALTKYYGGEKKTMEEGVFKDVMQELTEENVAVPVRWRTTARRWRRTRRSSSWSTRSSWTRSRCARRTSTWNRWKRRFRLRYRIDGLLHEMKAPPKRLQAAIIARLKIQSNMSISEHRIPQDGRIQSKVGNKLIDLRVSCLPTNHGESIVMRILDKEGLRLGLAELGFFTDDQQTFERMIGLPDGILLVTGPTGSGKTTTLYSCLHFINRPDRKIITVEDPVEYILAGINQVQVSEAVGLTFGTALRAILRQAPNVIMIGEIRDLETASIAINASLTGHLVFSTLHTNDAPSAVTRLIDIGVKPFLVASSTRCLMAQRLVRKVCKKCGEPYQPTEDEMRALSITPDI